MVDQTTQNDRSSFITILAWILIVMSGFAAFISILQNIMIHTLFPADQMQAAIASTKNSPNIPWFVEFMFNYFRWFVGAFLLLSLSTLVSAIGLLKRKNWARIVFISLMGFGIFWNVGGLLLQQTMFSWMREMHTSAPAGFPSEFESMATIMMIFSVVMAIGLSTLCGWIIKRLVSPAIRQEFLQALQ